MQKIFQKVINSINGNKLIYSKRFILSSGINVKELDKLLEHKHNFKKDKLGFSDEEIDILVDLTTNLKKFCNHVKANGKRFEYIRLIDSKNESSESDEPRYNYLLEIAGIKPKSFFLLRYHMPDSWSRIQDFNSDN